MRNRTGRVEVIANPYHGPRIGGVIYKLARSIGLIQEPIDVRNGKYYNIRVVSNLPKDNPLNNEMISGLMKALEEQPLRPFHAFSKREFEE